MNIEALLNIMRRETQKVLSGVAFSSMAYISGYDPASYMAKVLLDPTDPNSESGWMPIGAVAAGPAWGLFYAPSIGDQVMVDFMNGDSSSGKIRLAVRPDGGLQVPSGECWIVHKSGTFQKFSNDGSISLQAGSATLTLTAAGAINSAGTWNHTGALNVSDAMTAGSVTSSGPTVSGGNVTITGSVAITGTTTLTGAASITGAVDITGDLTVNGTIKDTSGTVGTI